MLQIVATQAGENLRRGVYSSKEWDSGSSEKECGKSVEGCEVSISEQWQDKAMTVAYGQNAASDSHERMHFRGPGIAIISRHSCIPVKQK